mmetsp:Transcript_1373/g.3872  ORF Transcript_1373/g.3872 Transcript_1373/m.3872 type:complete len:255 (-) Transcript_1373:67-831(-)
MATRMTTTTRGRLAGAPPTRCCLSQRPERRGARPHHAAKQQQQQQRKKLLGRQGSSSGSGATPTAMGASAHPDALRRREEAARRRSRRQREAEDGGSNFAQQATKWFADSLERVGVHLNVRAVGATGRQEFDALVREGVVEDGSRGALGGASPSSASAAGPGIVVAQFTADWCKACEEMQGKMFDIYSQHKDVTFIKVDAKHNLQLCRDLGVKRLPWVQIYAKEETRPVVNVHANRKNQKLLSRQLVQLKQMLE